MRRRPRTREGKAATGEDDDFVFIRSHPAWFVGGVKRGAKAASFSTRTFCILVSAGRQSSCPAVFIPERQGTSRFHTRFREHPVTAGVPKPASGEPEWAGRHVPRWPRPNR